MKNLILISFLILVSCIPSLQIGPDPHSTEFEKEGFEEVISYFNLNAETKGFDIENIPNEIPKTIINKMKEIGFLEYRNLGTYKVLFCGYGVVGKGWGFIYGGFTQKEITQPGIVKGNGTKINLTFLEHLEGKWYRFSAG